MPTINHPDSPITRAPVEPLRYESLALGLMVAAWIVFACAMPLHNLRAVRRQARMELTGALASGKADTARVLETFDRANDDVAVVAVAPCLLLAVMLLLLSNQLLKLKRRYNAALLDGRAAHDHTGQLDRKETG